MIVVCLKWVPTWIEIDPLSGHVDTDDRFFGFSPADQAALEYGLRLGDVTAVCLGPVAADRGLTEALAVGATAAIRLDHGEAPQSGQSSSASVALALATCCRSADLVLCGNHSLDRGSGSVPAFLARELGWPQALGLVDIQISDPNDPADVNEGALEVVRRLDHGRREILQVAGPAVLSVEGGLPLRRASLSNVIQAKTTPIDLRPVPRLEKLDPIATTRYRPPTRIVSAPHGSTIGRIQHLTGMSGDQTPPQLVALEPEAAADAIADQLRQWGYLEDDSDSGQ